MWFAEGWKNKSRQVETVPVGSAEEKKINNKFGVYAKGENTSPWC